MLIKTSYIFFCLCVFAFLIGGCATFHISEESAPKPLIPADEILSYHTGPLSDKAKIFLIAGDNQNANFAQEIIDQKKFWESNGISQEEIVCYYIIPNQLAFEQDKKQFHNLANELKSCYFASLELLKKHLDHVAVVPSNTSKPYLYLYFTSHGKAPISNDINHAKNKALRLDYLRIQKLFPISDEFEISIESLPDNLSANNSARFGALRVGYPEEKLFLTPRILKGYLKNFSKIPKFIVLQGCYSGGFLQDPRESHQPHLLSTLENITVITAARHDKTSFGCGSGDIVTFFGGSFNKALVELRKKSSNPITPIYIDWKMLFDIVDKKVKILENNKEISPHSEPQFFTWKNK